MVKYKLTIKQDSMKNSLAVEQGENLLQILQENNYNITSPCGGQGTCGKCKVKINQGAPDLSLKERELLTEREIIKGIRLACRIEVNNDLEVELEATEEIEVLTSGLLLELENNPEIKKLVVEIEKPTIEDQRDYLERIQDKLDLEVTYTLPVVKKLTEIDKEKPFTLTLKDNQVIKLESGDKSQHNYGIAIDIGTTTIALYLMDLVSGEELDVYSLHNPQKRFGADVISRINYSLNHSDGVEKLQEVLIEGLNRGIEQLISRNQLTVDQIVQLTVVGNTIMLHTLLGINAETIAHSPYTPVFTGSLEVNPQEIGIKVNSEGFVKLLPSVSGYVGADIIGDMLVADFSTEKWNLMIDIGTNGEIVLGNKDRLLACSAAAGPAFEGAKITFGMAGIPGAISECKLENGEVAYQTIAGKKAKGICGSGLVDIIAELISNGFLQATGAFVSKDKIPAEYQQYLTEYNGLKAFKVLTAEKTGLEEDIVLTQKDIREFQLARGAISAGIEILLKEAGIGYEDIDNIYLAGGFGNYINPHNACIIGLFPTQLEEKIVRIGNGAGMGAKMYLLNSELNRLALAIKNKVEYIELSSRADFQTEFMNSMIFTNAQ